MLPMLPIMTRPASTYRSRLFLRLVAVLSLLAAFAVLPTAAQAQTAQSVAERARDAMVDMYSRVDHFMVKTESYTSYNRIVEKDGEMQMENQMVATGGAASGAVGGSTVNTMAQMDALGQHGTYQGTQAVSGVDCHVIYLADPSKVDAQMSSVDEVTYYLGASDYLIHGMDMTMGDGTEAEMRLLEYRDYDGILYPSRMEMKMIQDEEEMQQRIQEMEDLLAQMSEAMRERMKDQIEQARSMMSGEPIVIETQDVVVNAPLPDGVFED